MMVGAAMTAKVTFNIGGRIVHYVYDKVKSAWTREDTIGIVAPLETYNMSNSVSLLISPVESPDQSKQTDDAREQPWVAKEIERLERQNLDLKKRNDEQGRLIVRLAKPVEAAITTILPQPPITERPPTTQLTTIAQKDDGQKEYLLYSKFDPRPMGGARGGNANNLGVQPDNDRTDQIDKVVKTFAAQIRDMESKGQSITINQSNVANNILVHNWGGEIIA